MNPSPKFVFIAGASRGIGNGFANAMLARNGVHTVFCAARSGANNEALTQLSTSHPERVVTLDLDVTDEESVKDCAARVRERAPRLDWIINTVGLLHNGNDMRPERQLADVQPGNIMRSFEVNSMGPLLLAKHLSRLLPRREPCTVATLSARVGSISDNRLGGW
ncbi:MAG: SDR family NAD(P)-dependent oxidoreductase, partial [Pseudomonadota bacterium]